MATAAMTINTARTIWDLVRCNVERGKIVGEIELPKQAQGSRPNFALDRDIHAIIVLGYDVSWMMVIDLKPLIGGHNSKANNP